MLSKAHRARGKSYRPYLLTYNSNSHAQVLRVPDFKVGRERHFLSWHEAAFYYLLTRCKWVTEMREQYPLEPDETVPIAAGLNIAHPYDPKKKLPRVSTIDFMITIKTESGSRDVARAVKMVEALDKPRNLELSTTR